MIALQPPATMLAEEGELATLCADPLFVPQHANWRQAYRNYRRRRGNGFALTEGAAFPDDVAAAQRKLYGNRRGGPRFRAVREQRLPGCARCGAPVTGHLDHHLPETGYPEYSLLLANLVPTCGYCNSGAKQAKVTGSHWPERFLHPYFDRFAQKPLWRVTVDDPVALKFTPRAEPFLRKRLSALVQFNLDNLLTWQFTNYETNIWKSLPAKVARKATGSVVNMADLDAALSDLEFSAVATHGVNGWEAALLRGIKDDPAIRAYLIAQTSLLPAPM